MEKRSFYKRPPRIYLLFLIQVFVISTRVFCAQKNINTKPKIFVFLIVMKDLCFEVI